MSLVIRNERPSDVAAIHATTVAAFLTAPHTDRTEQYIVDALRAHDARTISLVADHGGSVIGHVAVSPVSISDGTSGWFGLGPISILPAYQRQGIGSLLMEEALGLLRKQGASGCVLLGDASFYARFGFSSRTALVLRGVPPEYFQALPFDRSSPSGVVTYHEAFSAQG